MKRRNFLSGLMAAPLALKARIVQLFARKPVEPCGALILGGPEKPQPKPARSWRSAARNQPGTPRQREVIELLAEGMSMREAAKAMGLNPVPRPDCHRDRRPLLFCSLPRGHKGPHMLVNRQVKLTPLSFGPKNIALRNKLHPFHP